VLRLSHWITIATNQLTQIFLDAADFKPFAPDNIIGIGMDSINSPETGVSHPYRPRAVTTVSTIIYGPCRLRLAWRTLVAKVKDGVLLPAWYAQPNHEGTAHPLASVLAKSRLMSVVQESE
jgi:hypothetical protein